jgi:uncharacterized protein
MESNIRQTRKAASLLPGLLLAALCWPAGATADAACPAWAATHVRVGDQRFRVETAVSEAARERGLSGRTQLAAETGMWFVLPAPGLHGFWMQDMRFPIDLVWIQPDRRVIGVEGLMPCGDGTCPIHLPPAPVQYVLEVNAGHFKGRPGDQVDWTCLP